jgi:hypothetical protein
LIVRLPPDGTPPPTPTVRTGGGGRQFFFRYPAGSGLTIGTGVRPGIDFRGEGGYVVAPPSLHRSGRRYEWLLPMDTPLPEARAWLVALLIEGKVTAQRSQPPCRRRGMVLTVQAEPLDLVSSDGMGEGQRNATLCRLAGVHLARGDSLATVETLATSWAEKCTPPMTEDEAERTVRNLWQKHRRSSEDAEE